MRIIVVMDIFTNIIIYIHAKLTHYLSTFNFLDLIIVLIILFYIREGYNLGFTLSLLDLASFIIAFIAALKFYAFFAAFFTTFFNMPIGFANALAFFLVALVSEVILALIARRVTRYLPGLPRDKWFTKVFISLNHWLGIIPGLVSAFIILSFILSIIVTFPSSPLIKQAVNNSVIGSKLVANTSQFESILNQVFGGALNETLNFLTVEPKSNETIQLHFKVLNGTVDATAEQQMLQMVNQQRVSQGLDPLVFNAALRTIARQHSDDMFKRGYFSHFTPEGFSPFDRMAKAGINYQYAGENLALAPSTSLAMQGLMNSPGHRANILSPNFHKVGIGVINGGIYGEMFTQDFTN